MAPKSKTDSISFGYYVVALVDVLNQKENLRELSTLPQNPSEESLFIEAAQRTVGVIEKVRSAFGSFFDAYQDALLTDYPLPDLSDEQRKVVDAINTRESPHFQMFSHTMIIYQGVLDRNKKPSPRPVYTFFGACTSVMMASLAERVAVRGGVDVGVGIECWEDEIYGAVLASAHHLESKVAQYPRIVLGAGLVSYLRSFLEPRKDNVLGERNKIIAEICLDMIMVDQKGIPCLDYLGKSARRAFTTAADGISKDIERALVFITSEYDRFQDAGNETLTLRYGELRAYWESRSKLWERR